MKFITSLLVAVICVSYASARLTGSQREELLQRGDECSGLIRVTESDLEHLRNGDLSEPSWTQMCWIECVFERLGILNDGQIQTSVIMGSLTNMGFDAEQAASIIYTCENPEGINACQRAHSLAVCYLKNNAGLHHKKK